MARRLTDYKLGVFATQAYLDAHKPINEPDDLQDHTVIGYIDDLIFTPELDYLDEVSKGMRAKLQSSSLVAQMQGGSGGAGVVILPYYVAAADPRLIQILPEKATFSRAYWLIVHADSQGYRPDPRHDGFSRARSEGGAPGVPSRRPSVGTARSAQVRSLPGRTETGGLRRERSGKAVPVDKALSPGDFLRLPPAGAGPTPTIPPSGPDLSGGASTSTSGSG